MVNLKDLIIKFGLDKIPPLSTERQKQNKARNSVGNAIRGGKIKRPSICHMCFVKCKPDAHHPDYNRPFLVQWLCRSCHIEIGTTVTINTTLSKK